MISNASIMFYFEKTKLYMHKLVTKDIDPQLLL